MNKIILFGDSILAGSGGFGEILIDFLFIHHPRAAISTSIYGGKGTDFGSVLRETPLHIIGKAPRMVLLALGQTDVMSDKPVPDILREIRDIAALVEAKTEASLYLANICTPFFAGEAQWGRAEQLNRELERLRFARTRILDLNRRVEDFLQEHRLGRGEKRSLHVHGYELTSLGRLLLAEETYRRLNWPLEA